MQRIRYKNKQATVVAKKRVVFKITLATKRATITTGKRTVLVKATSPHKVKIAVKAVLKGMGVKFQNEYRDR